jgi:hypothetical protein
MPKIALVLAGALIEGMPAASTHAQQRPAQPANTSDVKGIVFELANSMGMLRGLQQAGFACTCFTDEVYKFAFVDG